MPSYRQHRVLAAVREERARQDALWGENRRLSAGERLAILTEELGEVAEQVCESYEGRTDLAALRRELVHVAASAVAWLEQVDAGAFTPDPRPDPEVPFDLDRGIRRTDWERAGKLPTSSLAGLGPVDPTADARRLGEEPDLDPDDDEENMEPM